MKINFYFRMHYFKGCVVLLVTLVYTFQIHGILEINFPSNKVGNYGKSTHMNCTDSPLDVTKGYRWYKDAVIIYNSANGDTGKYKSTHGNNYFTLEITNTQLTDNGVYQCNYDFQDQSHTLEIQAEGSGVGEVVDDKLVLKLTRFYPGTTTISAVLCNGKTITGSPEISSDGGSFFNLLWTSSNIVDTNDLKAGCDVTILSRSTYNIQVSVKIGPVCPNCEDRVIASIVFGILGIITLAGVIIFIVTNWFNNPFCLAVDVIGFVFDIISLGLSASVLADDKDSEDWILNSAVAFVVIPLIVAVTAIVVIILVCLGVIGPGRNGITKKLLHVLESDYPKILSVKDLIRKVDAEESVVMEQLEELKRKDLIRQLDSGGFVRHFLDVKTGITKQDLRPLEEIVCEKLLHVLESVYPNILSVKDLIRIDFAEESVVMEQLEELRRKDLIKQLDSGGFVRHFLDVKTDDKKSAPV